MPRPRSAAPAARGPLATLLHDARQPLASGHELDWYGERLPRDAGPVLEAMTGSGRLLLPLAAAGFNVHGVDHSAAMLASCEARLATANLNAILFRQDVAALNVPFRYAAAVVAAGAFQRIVDPVRANAALQRLRAHLTDPGCLLLDLRVPALAAHPPGAAVVEIRRVNLDDGSSITLRSETTVNVDARRIDSINRYERRGGRKVIAREDERRSLTWYTEEEVVTLMREAGYRDIRVEPAAATPEGDAHCFAVSARA